MNVDLRSRTGRWLVAAVALVGLVLFPLFVVFALVFRDRRIALPALAVSLVLLVIFTAQFAQGYWVL